jgi:hypothetical protein
MYNTYKFVTYTLGLAIEIHLILHRFVIFNIVAFRPQAKYTGRLLLLKLASISAGKVVEFSGQRIPTAINLGFLNRVATYSFRLLLRYPHEAKQNHFQTHYYLENLVAPGIEPVTSKFVGRNSDHKNTEAVRPQICHLPQKYL